MTELANKIKNLKGYNIPEYDFIPEGTWNMSVCGPFMWMGRQRTGIEKDGITRAASYTLRGVILMVEKLVDYAASKGADVTKLRKMIQEAWKHLLLSEVSDSSGWSPKLVEVQYTDNEVADAELILKEVLKSLKDLLPMDENHYLVNTLSGKVDQVASSQENSGTVDVLPVPFTVRAEKTISCIKKVKDNMYSIDIKGERPPDGAVEIVFDTPASGLFYSAGSGEDIAVEIPADYKNNPAFTLSNGFIYLNNGYSLIKDCSVEHIAATWKMKEQKLVFREELNRNNPEMNMRFYLLKGTVSDGLKLANGLNTWPSYDVTFSKSGISYVKVMPERLLDN